MPLDPPLKLHPRFHRQRRRKLRLAPPPAGQPFLAKQLRPLGPRPSPRYIRVSPADQKKAAPHNVAEVSTRKNQHH